MNRSLPLLVVVYGCVGHLDSEKAASLADYQAAVDDARALVAAHAEAVGAATSMSEVDELEALLTLDWTGCIDEMRAATDEVEHCGMGTDGMMGDAADHMGTMDDEVHGHVDAHDEHGDMDACHDAEDALTDEIDGHTGAMMEHNDHWSGDGGGCMGGM